MWRCSLCGERQYEELRRCGQCGTRRREEHFSGEVPSPEGTEGAKQEHKRKGTAGYAIKPPRVREIVHDEEECDRKITAGIHRVVSWAFRAALAVSLVVAFVRLLDQPPVTVGDYLTALGGAILVALLAGVLAATLYIMAVHAPWQPWARARPGAPGPRSPFRTLKELLEQALAHEPPPGPRLDIRGVRLSRDFVDDPDEGPEREATKTFLGELRTAVREAAKEWGPAAFHGGPGDEGFPRWAEKAVWLAYWPTEGRLAFVAVWQEGPRLALELVVGVAYKPERLAGEEGEQPPRPSDGERIRKMR
jgi:hypothetical protein